MPRGDRTGPAGMGSMTGRGLGGCSVGEQAMTGNYVRGFGYGAGRGGRPWGGGRGRCFGGGRGRMFDAQRFTDMTTEQETAVLEDQAAFLKEQADAVKSRIDELNTKKEKANPKT